jgi:nitrogen-specific signal transduction histidine kinase
VFDKNNEIRFMKIISHPTKNDSNVVLWKGSLEDITEKILIDQQLKKIETFSKGVLNSISSNISVIDSDGNIVAVNGSWNQFSITNGEPSLNKTGIGANYFTLLENAAKMGDESALDILKGIKDVIGGSATCYSREYECHTPNEKGWFKMNVAKFEGDESKVIITHENITQSKLAEEKVQLTHQKLSEISWMQSHIVRAPLAKIMSIANLLNSNLDQIEKKGKFKEMLHLLTLSANELDQVVRKISDKAIVDENILQKN